MGCLSSKQKKEKEFTNLSAPTTTDNNNSSSTANQNSEDTAPKQYSWSNRKVDRSNFVVNGKTGETIIRKPGSLNGSQFKVDKCEDCDIYVFDFTDSVYIDNCKNCRIFIGPVKGRVRDCDSVDVLLHCATAPVIETSKNMRFGCFQYNYGQLLELFSKAELSVFTNSWSAVYDFNHVPDSWSFLKDVKPLHPPSNLKDDIPNPFLKALEDEETTKEPCRVQSAVPKTWGAGRPHPYEDMRFLVFREGSKEDTLEYLERILKEPGIVAIQIAEKDTSVGVELCVQDPEHADKIIQPTANMSYVTDSAQVQEYVTQYFGQIELEI